MRVTQKEWWRPLCRSSTPHPGAMPSPVCGAKGSYAFVMASEAINSSLCIRCFGRAVGCSRLCEHKAPGAGGAVMRCTRRCSGLEDHETHLCHMHNDS